MVLSRLSCGILQKVHAQNFDALQREAKRLGVTYYSSLSEVMGRMSDNLFQHLQQSTSQRISGSTHMSGFPSQ